MPLLPSVAKYELECNFPDAILSAEELRLIMGKKYNEIYNGVIGNLPDDNEEGTKALLPYHTKSMELHRLRLDYAKSVIECADKATFVKYLNESIEAWAAMRTTAQTHEFLSQLLNNPDEIKQYVGQVDKDYIEQLANEYEVSGAVSQYAEKVKTLAILLQSVSNLRNDKGETVKYPLERKKPSYGSRTDVKSRKLIKF